MKKYIKIGIGVILSIVFLIIVNVLIGELKKTVVIGAQTDDRAVEVNRYKTYSFFSATTTNATSTSDGSLGMDIKGVEKVTFYFTHGGTATTSTGTSVFNVQVSPDEGTNWYNFNKLVQNLATSTTRTTSSTITVGAATTTTIASMDLEDDTFSRVRCIVLETGTEGQQGEHTCTASTEF